MNKKELKLNPFIIMIASTLFIVGCIIFSIPLYFGFLLGIIMTTAVLRMSGYQLKELFSIMISAMLEVKILCLVILLIGATTSVWLSSGIVPTLMYYGFTYMEGINFLPAAFLIMAAVSVFMGTAVGTISTVGIALMGIGIGLGIPVGVVIGAIVSGAFIADKISPISGLVNLTMTATKLDYVSTIKGFLPTLVPSVIIATVVYSVIGMKYTSNDYTLLLYYREAIATSINTPLILMSVPVIIILLSVLGVNSVLTISIGIGGSFVFSVIFQHMSVIDVVKCIFFGYNGSTASEDLNMMLHSGGVVSMIEVILIVVGSVILVRLFENSGILMPLIDKVMKGVDNRFKLIKRTGVISTLLTVVTCDQTVGIILPGSILQDKYAEFKLDNTVLARTISDTGTIVAPLMSWNVNSTIIKSLTGIASGSYALYAVFCYICPIVTVVYAYFRYGRAKNQS